VILGLLMLFVVSVVLRVSVMWFRALFYACMLLTGDCCGCMCMRVFIHAVMRVRWRERECVCVQRVEAIWTCFDLFHCSRRRLACGHVASLGCVACVVVDACNVGTTWLLLLCFFCDSDCDYVVAFAFRERGDVCVLSG